MIKPYTYYDFDEILDKYNETKDQKFLSYCFMKKNNLNINDISDIYNHLSDISVESIILFIINIQRELENEKPFKSFDEIKIENQIDDFDEFEDDYL